MNDVLCLATFGAKVLCLVVFIAVLRTVQVPISAEHCKIRWSAAPTCFVAAISVAGIRRRRAAAEDGSISNRQAC